MSGLSPRSGLNIFRRAYLKRICQIVLVAMLVSLENSFAHVLLFCFSFLILSFRSKFPSSFSFFCCDVPQNNHHIRVVFARVFGIKSKANQIPLVHPIMSSPSTIPLVLFPQCQPHDATPKYNVNSSRESLLDSCVSIRNGNILNSCCSVGFSSSVIGFHVVQELLFSEEFIHVEFQFCVVCERQKTNLNEKSCLTIDDQQNQFQSSRTCTSVMNVSGRSEWDLN